MGDADNDRGAGYAAELREIGDGSFAYLQTNGSWGWSNAGLVTSLGESLLVDTLYDLNLTRRMLDEMRRRTPAAEDIDTVVNTHANGDHCWGNQLLRDADIIASRRAAEEMRELSPSLMNTMVSAARVAVSLGAAGKRVTNLLGRIGLRSVPAMRDAAEFVVEKFGGFEFAGIELVPPTATFDGELTIQVGDKEVRLIEVGPAHTRGDAIVHVPADRAVFTGDILFIGSHPIAWEGPIANWIAACDRVLDLDVDTVVPGHGPITDKAGVRGIKEYWQWLLDESRARLNAGLSSEEAALDLVRSGLGSFARWGDRERLAVNVDTIYREIRGDRSRRDPLALISRMASFARRA
jgi:cyclase